MKAIRPLIREWQLAWYRWAEREMPALHPDKPFVVLRIRELEAECSAS